MITSIKRIAYILFFFCQFLKPFASQGQSINGATDEKYYFEVKQIEDFIDRFNFSPQSSFIKYYSKNYPNAKLNRTDLIKTLFYREGMKKKSLDTLKNFLALVTNAKQPSYLSFYAKNWYANLDCAFLLNGKPVNIKLVLEIQIDDEKTKACRWVICGMKSERLTFPEKIDSTKFISPSSHGTDFLALDKILVDKKNIVSYFYSNFKPSNLTLFMDALQNESLKFIQVNSVSYYFFQINDWIIEVNYKYSKSNYSGWLISRLIEMPEEDKDYFLYKNLGVQ